MKTVVKFKFFSLRYKFLLYFIVLSIVPTILTGYLCYYKSSKVIIQNAEDLNEKKLNSVAANINSIMSHVNEISHLILQNGDLRSYFHGTSSRKSSEILDFLSPFVGYNSTVSSIKIEGANGEKLSIGNDNLSFAISGESKTKADALNGYYYWNKKNSESDSFVFTRLYRNMFSLSERLGYIHIEVFEDSITNEYHNFLSSSGSIFLILDEADNILYSTDTDFYEKSLNLSGIHSDYSAIPEQLSLKETYVVSAQDLEIGWTIIDLTPTKVLLKDNRVISQIILAVVVFNTIVCVLLALYISFRHLAPLRALCDLIKNVGKQNFNAYPGRIPNDEVGLLATEFNKMSRQLEDLLNKVYMAQIRQSEAEFNALQAQINPHFLYNTLDTIYWMCRLEQAGESAELVKALGDTFRLSLNKGEGLISLGDELRHLTSYLTIQKKRCKTNIEITLDIDPSLDLQNTKVIKLILQPLVENAFIHGFSGKNNGSNFIKITIKSENNTILYIIEDNGIGINPQFVDQINAKENSKGFGIRNVNERIKLLFGADYGITVSSRLNYGTTILVRQPDQTNSKK